MQHEHAQLIAIAGGRCGHGHFARIHDATQRERVLEIMRIEVLPVGKQDVLGASGHMNLAFVPDR